MYLEIKRNVVKRIVVGNFTSHGINRIFCVYKLNKNHKLTVIQYKCDEMELPP